MDTYRQVLKTGRDTPVESELEVDGNKIYIRSTTSFVGFSKKLNLPLFVHWNEDITGTIELEMKV
jgi:hypothetical protein